MRCMRSAEAGRTAVLEAERSAGVMQHGHDRQTKQTGLLAGSGR